MQRAITLANPHIAPGVRQNVRGRHQIILCNSVGTNSPCTSRGLVFFNDKAKLLCRLVMVVPGE